MPAPKRKELELDSRVTPLLSGLSPALKFIVIGFALMVPPEVLEFVLGQITDRSLDLHKTVHDKPLLHWLGKTSDAPQKEGFSDEQSKDILEALGDRGVVLDDPPPPPVKPAAAADPTVSTPVANLPPAAINQESKEPTLAGHKLADLAGKSDQELLAIEGISRAGIELLRKWEAEQKAKATA